MRSIFSAGLGCVLALGVTGCVASPPGELPDGAGPSVGEGLELVPADKADNYYSTVAAEYEIRGTIDVTLTEEEFADSALRRDRAQRRLSALGLYLTTYLTDKFRGVDVDGSGEITDDEVFFHNVDYGSFHAMVRNRSFEIGDFTALGDGKYSVGYTVDVAGPRDFFSIVGGEQANGELSFDLKMPLGATANPERVSGGPIRNFDPSTLPAEELETHRLTVRAHAAVNDAYPHYAELIADGTLDITVFAGHDYNASREDLATVRTLYGELTSLGFTSPVARMEDLAADSGPFTKVVAARPGEREAPQRVTLEVRLFHSDMFAMDRPGQRTRALAELTGRDVFVYAGHAGPYYGFYLDQAGEAQISESDLRNAMFTADRQQLVFAHGCQTYSQYADVLYESENKSEANLDVITTVNFSYGTGTPELLRQLVAVDTHNYLRPPTYGSLIRELNTHAVNTQKNVFYGVMGIDGNPRLHPFANPEAIGRTGCTQDWDCGDHNGNLCLAYSDGSRRCAAVTLGEDACPAGTRFWQVQREGRIVGAVCMK